MKLSKALKEKNKRAKELNATYTKLVTSNSYVESTPPSYNSKTLLAEAVKQLDDFIAFKTALFESTVAIRAKIFRMGELKNFILQLQRMPVKNGVEVNHYSPGTSITYKADITELERDALVKKYETEIETIQDEIDIFNATTELKEF